MSERTRTIGLWVAAGGMLLLALSLAPMALAAGGLWFVWRLVSYATAKVVYAEIVDWRHERQPDLPSASIAYAQLQFVDESGREHTVSASVGVPTDLAMSGADPLPEGPVRLRYRPWPFLALEDDKGVWLTGPSILLATAVLGTMLKLLFRFSPLAWVMGW